MGAALASLLVKIGGKTLSTFLDLFTKSAWRKVGAWTTLMALVTGLYATISGLIAAISYIMPNWVSVAASWVVPDNAVLCVTTYIAGSAAITLFKWKMRGIQLSLGL